MKKLFLPFLSMFTYNNFISAQESSPAAVVPVEKIRIEVQESKEKMSLGVNNCLKVYIPDAIKENVDRDLLKYMKNYNSKGDSKKSEYFYDNAEIKAFGNNQVDVYAQTEQKAGGVELKVFFASALGFKSYVDINFKKEISWSNLNLDKFKKGWQSDLLYSQGIGEDFIKENQFCCLQVPSAIVVQECNLLFNPNHKDFKKIKIVRTELLNIDKRLKA